MQSQDKIYDLAARTEKFAREVRAFVKREKKIFENVEDLKQLIRSSGSVGANYLEAEESIGEKDFVFRIKLCRKEAKESAYWCRLLKEYIHEENEGERMRLANEAIELTKIFGAIIKKRSQQTKD